MADQNDSGLCPERELSDVVGQLRDDDQGGLATIGRYLQSWPLDPRLHFLKGSVLAGLQRYDEARGAMARAIEIAPDYALARFQLGFLDLTSGRAIDALGVWQPLGALPDDFPLRVLAEGLANLCADQFGEAVRLLRKGMALNAEHPLINGDMQLILDEIEPLAATEPGAAQPTATAPVSADEDAPASAVDLLLRQQGMRGSPSKLGHS